LHAAINEGIAKWPEREQLKAVFSLEERFKAAFAKGKDTTDTKATQPKKELPKPPPKMKRSGAAPKEDVITADDLIKRYRETGKW
jgi:hypothetical protein